MGPFTEYGLMCRCCYKLTQTSQRGCLTVRTLAVRTLAVWTPAKFSGENCGGYVLTPGTYSGLVAYNSWNNYLNPVKGLLCRQNTPVIYMVAIEITLDYMWLAYKSREIWYIFVEQSTYIVTTCRPVINYLTMYCIVLWMCSFVVLSDVGDRVISRDLSPGAGKPTYSWKPSRQVRSTHISSI